MRRAFRLVLRLLKGSVVAALVLAGAVAAGLLSLWLTVNRHFEESEVSVPVVTGLRVEEAARRLAAVDLELRIEARRPHETVVPGLIFFQEPRPQARTRRKRRVRVYLSTGPRRTTVPDLSGQSARAGLLTLGQAGLTTGEVLRVHANAASSEVIAQDPPPGNPVGDLERVDLLVSSGPWRPAYVMPDFEGRSVAEVELALAGVGLRLAEVRQQVMPGVPGGHVASQAPEAGSRVATDTPIRIVVSQRIEVPVGRDFGPRPRLQTR